MNILDCINKRVLFIISGERSVPREGFLLQASDSNTYVKVQESSGDTWYEVADIVVLDTIENAR